MSVGPTPSQRVADLCEKVVMLAEEEERVFEAIENEFDLQLGELEERMTAERNDLMVRVLFGLRAAAYLVSALTMRR